MHMSTSGSESEAGKKGEGEEREEQRKTDKEALGELWLEMTNSGQKVCVYEEMKDSDTMRERMEEKKYEEGSGENIQS